MGPEGNSLDLNNLPDDYSRDGQQLLKNNYTSPTGCNKKVGGEDDDGKEECGKVYECRFCSLKFCKSQALGGHMNRHRQEKETEKLNQARQLLFNNDPNLAAQAPPHHLGYCQPGGYHHPSGNMGDPTVPLRFPGYMSGSSSTHMPPPPPPQPYQPYLYPSPPPLPMSFPSHNGFPQQHPIMKDYHVGHVMSSNHHQPYAGHHNMNMNMNYGGGGGESSYTCIGAPVGQGFPGSGVKDMSLHPPASAINRFQDGF